MRPLAPCEHCGGQMLVKAEDRSGWGDWVYVARCLQCNRPKDLPVVPQAEEVAA